MSDTYCRICGTELVSSEVDTGICYKCTQQYGSNISAERLVEIINKRSEDRKREEEERAKTIAEREQQKAARDKIKNMLLVTTETIPGYEITNTLGLVRGGTVRSKHLGRDVMAEIKNIVGGELKGYTQMQAESREEALYRMKEDALRLGADTVIGVRIASSQISDTASEVIAYGTAVTISPASG